MSRRGRTPSWCSTARAGTRPRTCAGPTRSRRCRYRPTARSSIRKSGSGSSCGSITWPYAASLTSPPCSTPAKMPGAASSARRVASAPFAPIHGLPSHKFLEAVLVVAGHVAAEDVRVGTLGRGLVDDPAVAHHQDPVGELQDLVQVLGDQQHGRTAVT